MSESARCAMCARPVVVAILPTEGWVICETCRLTQEAGGN